MSYIDLFPTTIYINEIQKISNKNIKEFIEFITQEEYILDNGRDFTSNQKLLNNKIFSFLKKRILYHSKLYLSTLEHVFEDLQISNSWATSLKYNVRSGPHNHPNSYISGVYYLTEGSPIHFYDPTQFSWFFESKKTENFKDHFYITPQPNLLVLFPSFLSHSILVNKNIEERRSIAFNIIPKGEFGPPTAKLYL